MMFVPSLIFRYHKIAGHARSRSFITRKIPLLCKYSTDSTPTNIRKIGNLYHAVKSGSNDMIESIWRDLKEKGIKPEYNMYELLIEYYTNKRSWIKAQKLLKEMCQPDINYKPNARIYGLIVNGIMHSQRQDSRFVSGALKDLKSRMDLFARELTQTNDGADKARHEYYHLITSYAKLLQLDKATRLFKEFEAKFGPDVFVFNGLLKAFVQCHKITELRDIFRERQANHMPLNTISYNIAIELFCKANLIDDALDLFARMKDDQLAPDEATYAVLIDGMGFANKFPLAVQIFEESKKTSFRSSTNITSSLIESAARCKEFASMFQLIDLNSLPALDRKLVRTFFECIYRRLDADKRPVPPFNWHSKWTKSDLRQDLTAEQKSQFIAFWDQCATVFSITRAIKS